MKKVFWCFPSGFDSSQKWKRVDTQPINIQQQIKWLRHPTEPNEEVLRSQGRTPHEAKEAIKLAQKQYQFALEYNNNSEDANKQPGREKERVKDLNYHLINYVELKFNDLWSEEKVKEKKWELKQQNTYFRLVKQGSILVYLTSHLFVIFVILLMATLRQSFVSLVYFLLILLSLFRTRYYAAGVLTQRDQNIHKQRAQTEDEIRKQTEIVEELQT